MLLFSKMVKIIMVDIIIIITTAKKMPTKIIVIKIVISIIIILGCVVAVNIDKDPGVDGDD